MNQAQRTAIAHHCRLAGETPNPIFGAQIAPGVSRLLSVNSGWE